MGLSIDDLRAAFSSTNNNNGGGGSNNNYYPFWDIKVGERAIVRFVKDKNENNPLGFLVEKKTHTLELNGERKNVPCLSMYGEECPICKVSQAYYKENDKVNGKKFWRKLQHVGQVLVMEDPLQPGDDGETHEGKIRYVSLGFQLYNVIKEAFESGDLDQFPYAYDGGYNFIIKKSKQGDYDSYTAGSGFARKASDIEGEELALIEDQMVDLSTLLPQKPALAKVEAMLEAALTGGEYKDDDSSSSAGGDSNSGGLTLKKKDKPAASTVADDDDDEAPRPSKKAAVQEATEDDSDDGSMSDAEALLAKIRSRRAE